MSKQKIDFETVKKLGLELPQVEVSKMYGSPALKVQGKLLACIAVHRSAEPGSLVVRIDFERRDECLATAPDIYYITEHYEDYPAVLVRLSRIGMDALRDLLSMSWTFVTRRPASGKRVPRKQEGFFTPPKKRTSRRR